MKTTIDKDCSELSGRFANEVFFNCKFDRLNDLVLEKCDLNMSTFVTEKLEDALGFTLTLNCHSFSDVEFSPLLFDLFLCLAIKSKGNTEKRKKLIDVVGHDRAYELLKQLKDLE